MKVYVVTAQKWDDFFVDAVFADRDEANRYCEKSNAESVDKCSKVGSAQWFFEVKEKEIVERSA